MNGIVKNNIAGLVLLLISLIFGSPYLWAAENRSILETEEVGEKVIDFSQQLKTAVCDESYINHAPTLDILWDSKTERPEMYSYESNQKYLPSEILGMLLGVEEHWIYSDKIQNQIRPFKNSNSTIPWGEIKKKSALAICEGLVSAEALKQQLAAKQSLFIKLKPSRDVIASTNKSIFKLIDPEKRFGAIAQSDFLVGGWISPSEVRSVVSPTSSKEILFYERVSNPITNNLLFIRLDDSKHVPLAAVTSQTSSAQSSDFSKEKILAESQSKQTHLQHVQVYLQMIENEALEKIHLKREKNEEVKNLLVFFRNLLEAYKIYPDEKQFEGYRSQTKLKSIEHVLSHEFDKSFWMEMQELRKRVSSLNVMVFKPDPKLHAIYLDFKNKLNQI